MMQNSFTTAMYGKKDYTQERNDIIKELIKGKQTRVPGYKYPDENLWETTSRSFPNKNYSSKPNSAD